RPPLPPPQPALRGTWHHPPLRADAAVVFRAAGAPCDDRKAARLDPRLAYRRQPGGKVDLRIVVGIRAGRVVYVQRRRQRIFKRDLAHWHAQRRMPGWADVDLAGAADRAGGNGKRCGAGRDLVHGSPPEMEIRGVTL